MLQQRFRQDYTGEYVILNTIFRDGRKIQQREWIPNRVTNQHISGRAVVLCGTQLIGTYDVTRLAKHKGGLLASRKFQIYGVDSVWEKVPCEFLVSYKDEEVAKLIGSGYAGRSVVYTSPSNLLKYPNNFYLVPYTPSALSAEATAMYLAAFDGHQEVFVVNFDQPTQKEAKQVETVIRTYPSVQFVFVAEKIDPRPEALKNLVNCKFMDQRQWVSYCDV